MQPSGVDVGVLRRALLRWYDRHHRKLPWRRARLARDPYAIWVSEVMLQQTRVSVVVPYYLRFLKRFPTVLALARAREADVLRLWSGLGYYRRARQMRAAAREIRRRHGGHFPAQFDELLALPGVGRYTAGAVLSIVYDRRAPAVDGNVVRVAQRITGRSFARPAQAEAVVREWLPRAGSGRFNQALMELGATVCTPRAPMCPACPVNGFCSHTELGRARRTSRPLKITERFALLRRGERVWLEQRSDTEPLMAGMWQLPQCERSGERLGEVRHAITYRDIRAEIWRPDDLNTPAEGRWFTRRQAFAVPLTGLARKILRNFVGWEEDAHSSSGAGR